jgi:hypothetical protein
MDYVREAGGAEQEADGVAEVGEEIVEEGWQTARVHGCTVLSSWLEHLAVHGTRTGRGDLRFGMDCITGNNCEWMWHSNHEVGDRSRLANECATCDFEREVPSRGTNLFYAKITYVERVGCAS